MKGLGTKDTVLLSLVARNTNESLQLARREFAKSYGKDLIAEVRSETSGNYRDLLVALLQSPIEYKANELRRALKGLGTDESALIDILAFSRNAEIKEIAQYYAKTFHNGQPSLEDDVIADTSFNFKKALVALVKGNRDETTPVNTSQAAADAEALYKKGEGKVGTDDDFFIQILTSRSQAHLAEVSKIYYQKHSKELEKAIELETSGDYKNILVALVRNPICHFADSIYQAVKGLGTNNRKLIRAIVYLSHNRNLVPEVKAYYQKKYGKPLNQDIANDTSFNFKKTLLAVLE